MQEITTALEAIFGDLAGLPGIGVLFAGLDAALAAVLVGLETLLAGVLNLVSVSVQIAYCVLQLISEQALGERFCSPPQPRSWSHSRSSRSLIGALLSPSRGASFERTIACVKIPLREMYTNTSNPLLD